MSRCNAQRKRHCISLEPLESRELLSGGASQDTTAGVRAAAALTITAALAPASDPDGNGVVVRPTVVIQGQTARGATVVLDQIAGGALHRTTKAGPLGRYNFTLTLPIGRATFQVSAANGHGQSAATVLSVTRGDAIIDWNTDALNAVRAEGTNPPFAARNFAMVQIAVFDAVNSIDRQYVPYAGIQESVARGTSETAAVAGAADEVLRALYPKEGRMFAATLFQSLSLVPSKVSATRGLALGRAVGDAVLALRNHDGSGLYVAAPPATKPGDWSPTPPTFEPAVGLNFAFVTPFALASPSQFRPGPPPALDSAAYAAAYNEVKLLGSVNSTVRTADQTAFARFWSDLPGVTFTPPGHWNQVAQDAAMSERLSLSQEAHLFALLDIALADAGISCWETKNFYDFWRPVTAIRVNSDDVNPMTTGDPTWTPLWATPAFSSYTSGHATFSAAAAAVLDSVFGANFAFTDYGDPAENLPPRDFTSFDQAAAEAAASRMYGGIHLRFDNETGLAVGKEVGDYVIQHVLMPL
jgi:hypothetical protein